MICQGWIHFVQTRIAMAKERTIIEICVPIRTERFEKRSAIQPPQVEKTSIGAVPAAATTPNNALEPVS